MPNRLNLSNKEEDELKALLAEADRRGIPLDKVDSNWSREFILGSNGYFVKKDGTLYTPTTPQEDFIRSKARFVLFYGSRGSGKTGSGGQKALFKIKQGESGAIYNPDFENLKTATWPEFREWVDWSMVVPNQRYRGEKDWEPVRPFTLNFNNGAEVRIKGVKDPDAARGPNINWLWYDEGSRDKTGESFQIAVASVRVGKDPQTWVTATPAGIDHWMYDFFIEQNISDEALEAYEEAGLDYPLIESFYGTIRDNKDNLDPGFYASMLTAYTDGWLKEQEIGGKFVEQGGVLGNRDWFAGKIIPYPEDLLIKKRIRYWDLAASERKKFKGKKTDPDESVGTLESYTEDETGRKYYIEDQVGGYWEYAELRENIMRTAMKDGPTVPIFLEEEPGSGGKNQVAAIKEWVHEQFNKKGIPKPQIEGWRPPNDRVILANLWFAEAAKGKVYMIKGDWNKPCLDQLSSFPIARHDDRITSITGARMNVAPIQEWSSPKFLAV